MGQSLDKLLMTNIGKQHPKRYRTDIKNIWDGQLFIYFQLFSHFASLNINAESAWKAKMLWMKIENVVIVQLLVNCWLIVYFSYLSPLNPSNAKSAESKDVLNKTHQFCGFSPPRWITEMKTKYSIYQLTSALSGCLHPIWCSSRRRCWHGLLALEWKILERPLMTILVRKWWSRDIWRSWLWARVRTFIAAVQAVLLWGRRWRIYGGPTACCHHCSGSHWIHWGARKHVRIGVISVVHADSRTPATSRIFVVSKQKVFLSWKNLSILLTSPRDQ